MSGTGLTGPGCATNTSAQVSEKDRDDQDDHDDHDDDQDHHGANE